MFVRDFASRPVWLSGTIECLHGPVSFDIQTVDGRVVYRHIEHVRSRDAPEVLSQPPFSYITWCYRSARSVESSCLQSC